ncbi:Josephin-domain-containing protein [Flagelloscypha sp. PMI_526]|nr:Josephin-domain-containing protein [Flagelloscypha sp. PMI_526]
MTGNAGTTSTNMDDTGFFSVQVLDRALDVWGLNLVRWRSEEMKKYHDHPFTQLAFILNYEQHWYTLRRFGDAKSNVAEDPGHGHWFNLNSYKSQPEWVSKTYLGMVLQQAEADGYSVFAVVQANPEGPLALTRTDADIVASTLPEPTSSRRGQPQAGTSSSTPFGMEGIEGVEDEDWELQAALQASLVDGVDPTFLPNDPLPTMTEDYDEAINAADPVAASMARNQRLLARMQREQQMAHRDLFEGSDQDPATTQRVREMQEEQEMIRKAIAESEALAQAQAGSSSEATPEISPPLIPAGNMTLPRVYDDEDAELQAALRASLEDSAGHVIPDLKPKPPSRPTASTNVGAPIPVNASTSMDSVEEELDEPTKPVDMDEMRRRRLERFGA